MPIADLVAPARIREVIVPWGARALPDSLIRRHLAAGRVVDPETLTPLHLRPCTPLTAMTTDDRRVALCLFRTGDGRGLVTLPDGTVFWFAAGRGPDGLSASPLAGTLTTDLLTGGRYVAYTDLWAVTPPDGDPIVFRPDGIVENHRAGLAGRWRIAEDGALMIDARRFTWDANRGALWSPLAAGGSVGFSIYRADEGEREPCQPPCER